MRPRKPQEAEEAKRLRAQEGKSVKEIARLLQVSPSSVSLWVRNIELDAEQRTRLDRKQSFAHANLKRMSDALLRRQSYQDRGRARIHSEPTRYVAGCMLYWAEGSKKRNALVFVNSDAAMMKFFVDFLREFFAVQDHEITLNITSHATAQVTTKQTEEFWLNVLGLGPVSLGKGLIREGFENGPLKYGIARIVVYRTDIVQEILGAIQGFADFERNAWIQ